MQIGIHGSSIGEHGTPHELAKNAQLAEKFGFDHVTISDSQFLKRELYTCLAIIAEYTDSIQIGPLVTNPVTRDITVATSALCTLNEISEGRTLLGFSSGDSAVRTMGKKPATIDEMENYITKFKKLHKGEMVEINDTEVEIFWVDNQHIPVIWAADGPKTQRLAGKLADITLISSGITQEIIDNSFKNIVAGAQDAGRDPASIEKWISCKCNINEDKERAIEEAKSSLVTSAHYSFHFGIENKHVPRKYHKPIKTLIDEYDSNEHHLPKSSNKDLINDELAEYLANRFGVFGTPEECTEKIEEIMNIDSVDGIHLGPITGKKRENIKLIGKEVLSRLPDSDTV